MNVILLNFISFFLALFFYIKFDYGTYNISSISHYLIILGCIINIYLLIIHKNNFNGWFFLISFLFIILYFHLIYHIMHFNSKT